MGELNHNSKNAENSAPMTLDKRYVSPDLAGKDAKISEKLSAVTKKLRQDYAKNNKVSYEAAANAVKEVKPFKDELSEKAKKSYTKFKKALNFLNNKSGHTVNLVVTEAHNSFNGAISGDTMYIGSDTFESNKWAETLVHEYTHFAEGTEEYSKLVEFLKGDRKLVDKSITDILEKSGYGFDADETSDLLTSDIDSDERILYNRKKIAQYIPYSQVGNGAIRHIKTELRKIYNNEDGVADGVAIEYGNNIYIVDSGRENGSISFGVRKKITVSNDAKRSIYIQEINKESAKNGYGDREVFEKLGVKLDYNSGSNVGRESIQDRSVSEGESQDNQGGVLGENADNGRLTNEVTEDLTNAERESLSEYQSELGAHMTANLLGSESFIDKLVRDNTTIAEKILNKLSNLKKRLECLGNPDARAEYKKIKKAEKLYLDAVEKAGYAYVGRKIISSYQERESDESDIAKYNRKFDSNEGDVLNGKDESRQENIDTRGTDSNNEKVRIGAQEKNGDGSRVQETVGEGSARFRKDSSERGLNRKLTSTAHPFENGDYITPPRNSPLYALQSTIIKDYDIECYIVNKSAWKRAGRKNPAMSGYGKIYISEDIESVLLRTLVPHEMSHIMKQLNFDPYKKFVDSTPEKLNYRSTDFPRLMNLIANHCGIDVLDMNEEGFIRFYDELNATVFGLAEGGIISDSEYDYEWIPNAFHDFETYITELKNIHEEFKSSRNKKSSEDVKFNLKSENNVSKNIYDNIFVIKTDTELAQRIANSTKSKYTVIKEYLVEKFYNKIFTMSDGKKAIMDKSDAQHISYKADDQKTAELANLESLIEQANLFAHVDNVVHDKFDAFFYYETTIAFNGETDRIVLNVGRSKYDNKNHIYDITKYKERSVANQSSTGLSRPVGNALKNNASNNSISENSEKINSFSKKTSEDTKFNLKSDNYEYSENQYSRFGWARYADALTSTELDDLYSKVQAKSSLRAFKQSSKGEAIIEVNNKPHTTLDIDNVFVFVKGAKSNFTITRVVRFTAETETEMEIIKEELYEGRTWSDSYCSFLSQEGLAKEFSREDTEAFEQYQQKARRRSGRSESRRANQYNRRSEKYRSGYSLSLGEDGEISEDFKFNLKSNSATQIITADMTDSERTEILSKKQVVAPIYTGQADAAILANKSKLESGKIGIVASVIQKLGEDFCVVGEEINIEDAEVVIMLSKSNLRKSVTAEATPGQLAKLIPILKDTAQNAIGVERHDNRYFFDSDTVYFDNLLGGYIDDNDFVPVRFGLKHSRTGNVVLYVVVDQNKIPRSSLTEIKKTEVVKTPALQMQTPEASRSVTYSIAQIIEFVNSGDLLRYIPDEMLTEAQKTTKYEAIAKTIERTNTKNDERYLEFIKDGNLWEAGQMVLAAAKAAGYTIEGYHGTRQTFTAFSNESKGSNTRTETSKRMFFAADKATANSYYPYGVMQAIHEQHPEWAWADPEKVKVKGNLYHLFIRMSNPLTVDVADYDYAAHRDSADSWMEFVAQAEANHNDGIILLNAMDNQLDTSARASTVYMFAQPSQAKSAETITYDDEGNIIPLSKRFNSSVSDIRFNLKSDDKVTMSKGEYQKKRAEYTKEKVYSKKEVTESLSEIPYFSELTAKTRNDIIDSMWYSLNTIESNGRKETFIEQAFNRILRELGNESKSFNDSPVVDVAEIEMRIAKTVRDIVKMGGKDSMLTKQERELAKTEAGRWKKKYEESVRWNEIVGELMHKAEKMQNLKYGKFLNASQYKSDLFKGSIEKLSRIKFRGNLNASGTRDIIKNLSHWYVPENPMFKISGEGEARTSELYDEYIASILKNISDGNGEISLRELSALNEVMGYFVHFVEGYNKIKRNVFEIQKIKAQVKTFRFDLRF